MYTFSGFFVKGKVVEVEKDHCIVRRISDPFVGSGVNAPELVSSHLSEKEIRCLAADVGIDKSDHWMCIVYTCWAGRVDLVFGYVNKPSESYGPVSGEEEDGEQVLANLFREFGLSEKHTESFTPFERDFWGEYKLGKRDSFRHGSSAKPPLPKALAFKNSNPMKGEEVSVNKIPGRIIVLGVALFIFALLFGFLSMIPEVQNYEKALMQIAKFCSIGSGIGFLLGIITNLTANNTPGERRK